MSNIRVSGSQNLCPSCNQTVDPTSVHSVCRHCLTRHHSGCWQQRGNCGAMGCGSHEQLSASDAPSLARSPITPGAAQTSTPNNRQSLLAIMVGVALLTILAGVAAVVLRTSDKPNRVKVQTTRSRSTSMTVNPLVTNLPGFNYIKVSAAVMKQGSALHGCCQRSAQKGSVEITLTIATTGRIVESQFAYTRLSDTATLEACLRGALKGWKFPTHQGGPAKISIPIKIY